MTAAELRALVEASPDWSRDVTLDCAGRGPGLLWVASLMLDTPGDEPVDADPCSADAFVDLAAHFDRATLLRLVQLWEAAEALEVAFKACPDVSGLVGSLGRVRAALAALRGEAP